MTEYVKSLVTTSDQTINLKNNRKSILKSIRAQKQAEDEDYEVMITDIADHLSKELKTDWLTAG